MRNWRGEGWERCCIYRKREKQALWDGELPSWSDFGFGFACDSLVPRYFTCRSLSAHISA